MTTETVEEAGPEGSTGGIEPSHAGGSLGRYRLLEVLGEGGMGIVHRAYDQELDRMVALKIVRTRASDREEARERLLREGRAIARLHHPNVVKVHEVDMVDGRLFLAMELVRGVTLKDWLAERPRDWKEVLPILLEAGAGLAAAHDVGLVHRDFKPANVLIGRDGRVRVADFGLARAATSAPPEPAGERREGDESSVLGGLTQMGTVMGTPAYMAPEQHLGEMPGPRADQFAFCVALWEAVHGVRPFAGASRQELMSNIARDRTTPQRRLAPRWLQRVMARGLRADPDLRHPTMHELLRDLERGPTIARWARIAIVSSAAVAVAAAFGFEETLRARQECVRAGAAMAAGWTEQRSEVEQAFAGAAARTVTRALDQHALALEATAREACEAGGVRGEERRDVVEATARCLEDRAADLRALASMLAAGGDEPARAIDALAGLGRPADCRRAEWVLGAYPRDVAGELAGVRALLALGRFAEAERAAASLTATSDSAEPWLLLGRAQAGQGAAGASDSLWRSTWTAEAGADDGIGASAWVELAALGARLRAHDEVRRHARLAEHAIARGGGDDRNELALALALADDAVARGRPDEVIAALDRRPTVDDTVTRHPLEARALLLRGRALLLEHRQGEAASDLVRALALASDLYGPEHARVLEIRRELAAATGE